MLRPKHFKKRKFDNLRNYGELYDTYTVVLYLFNQPFLPSLIIDTSQQYILSVPPCTAKTLSVNNAAQNPCSSHNKC